MRFINSKGYKTVKNSVIMHTLKEVFFFNRENFLRLARENENAPPRSIVQRL